MFSNRLPIGWMSVAWLAVSLAIPATQRHGVAGAAPAEGRPPLGDHVPSGDSVLAVVGTGRTVTLGGLIREYATVTPAVDSIITPQAARRFLDLLVDRELLLGEALRGAPVWTARESAQFLAFRDRLMLRAALDSALRDIRLRVAATGDSTAGEDRLGIAVRDSAAARLGLAFDEALVARLAAAWRALPRPSPDSSLERQLDVLGALPAFAPSDTGLPVARSSIGEYRVRDLLEAWRRLSPAYRPRIETGSQVKELTTNGVFERMLRLEAERRHLDRAPSIAAALERARGEIAVTRLLEREVYGSFAPDSATLRRFYRQHRGDWALPTRVRLTSLTLADRATADQAALRLRDPAEVRRLEEAASRGGLSYATEVSALSDSALFAAAMRAGSGAVLGPDPVGGAWRVAGVGEILPARIRSMDEAREPVLQGWKAAESERRMQALMIRLRARTRVIRDDALLDRAFARGGKTP